MLCDECHLNEAEVQITEVDEHGKLTEKHLCKECAEKKGYLSHKHKTLNQLFAEFLEDAKKAKAADDVRCTSCGMSWEEFRQLGRFGCSLCYESFGERVERLIGRIHGTTRHTGRGVSGDPRTSPVLNRMEIKRLRKELAQAIEAEEFEKAARLRDQMRKYEERSGDS